MQRPVRFLCGRWPWLSLSYLLISAAIGLALLALFVAAILLLPFWGLLVGALERRRTRLLGYSVQRSAHVPIGPSQRMHWLSVRIAEQATWREVCAAILDLIFGWIIAASLFFEGIGLVVLGALFVIGSRGDAATRPFPDVPLTIGPQNAWLLLPVILCVLAILAYVNALLALLQVTSLRALCGPRPDELGRNIDRLLVSRAALLRAFESERRRIERDLHDGVQQELIVLGARIGLASFELEEVTSTEAGVQRAREALAVAQVQAERTMSSLRDTVRGTHPAVLTERGLRPALQELARRGPQGVRLRLASFGRLSESVEITAYYFVTEALTNAAKHASATEVRIDGAVEFGELTVRVTDNGRGGANEQAGTGLGGLRERAEILGGTFAVSSPRGGPTTLTMTLPAVSSDHTAAPRKERNATPAR